MREQFQPLYTKHRKCFEVWNYLWLFANNNKIEFTYLDLSGRFALPRTTVVRYVTDWMAKWNQEKVHIELEQINPQKGLYRMTFYPTGKRSTAPKDMLIENCYKWVQEYYENQQYDYPDLLKHKRYIGIILNKIEEVMKKRGTEISDDSKYTTFRLFFERMPKWWVENRKLNLPVLSKNFSNIINQIKATNGKSAYTRTAEATDGIDYSDLAKK